MEEQDRYEVASRRRVSFRLMFVLAIGILAEIVGPPPRICWLPLCGWLALFVAVDIWDEIDARIKRLDSKLSETLKEMRLELLEQLRTLPTRDAAGERQMELIHELRKLPSSQTTGRLQQEPLRSLSGNSVGHKGDRAEEICDLVKQVVERSSAFEHRMAIATEQIARIISCEQKLLEIRHDLIVAHARLSLLCAEDSDRRYGLIRYLQAWLDASRLHEIEQHHLTMFFECLRSIGSLVREALNSCDLSERHLRSASEEMAEFNRRAEAEDSRRAARELSA